MTAHHPVAAGSTLEDLELGGGCLFVALGSEVLVLDPANAMAPVCDPIAVAADAIAVSDDGLRLYACNSGGDTLQSWRRALSPAVCRDDPAPLTPGAPET